jgi:hypothetical protein
MQDRLSDSGIQAFIGVSAYGFHKSNFIAICGRNNERQEEAIQLRKMRK